MKIDSFEGPNRFLSNFAPSPVTMDGAEYPSVENAYQAAKAPAHARGPYLTCSPGEAKKRGRREPLPADWEQRKVALMLALLRAKFHAGSTLAHQLLMTGALELIEGNWWGDKFWGVCRGQGQNWLGRLLMTVRQELREQ